MTGSTGQAVAFTAALRYQVVPGGTTCFCPDMVHLTSPQVALPLGPVDPLAQEDKLIGTS